MGHLLHENIPKLLPVWHDLSMQDVVQAKSHRRFLEDKLPDFSGAGIHVRNWEDKAESNVVKYNSDETHFGAHICSLPFFPPRKVSVKSDPCLIPMNASKCEVQKFCVALEYLRRYANKTDGKFRRELLSCYKIAKIMRSKELKTKKFSVPETILQLATEFPKSCLLPEANFDYLGGCLTLSQTTNENHILLHPVGKKLNKLGITPLVEINDPDKAYDPTYAEMKTVKLKNNFIQKIKCYYPGHCFVQQGNIWQYVNFSNHSQIHTQQIFKGDINCVNIASSPYNPTEFVYVDDSGILKLQNIGEQIPLWISRKVLNIEPLKYTKLKACAFGSHPKSVLCLHDDCVYIYDLRLGGNSSSTILSNHFSSFPEEKFLNVKYLAAINPFQHLISSTNHLYVCDERYLKSPVLIWSHLLKSFPLYCDIACLSDSSDTSSDAVALLASQESRELCLFTLRTQQSQIQPISLCTPSLLSSPSDFIDSLKLHGKYVNDDLVERIMNPLIGVCALPHRKKKGFTAFQMSSFGDVFYQDFYSDSPNDSEQTYRVDTGCILTPPDRILPHVSKWTDFSFKSSKKIHSSRSGLVSVNVDLTDILNDCTNIPSGCYLCNNNAYSCDREAISTDICSSCGLNNEEVEKYLDSFNKLGLLAGPVVASTEPEGFDVSPLSEFDDEYSKEILRHWSYSEVLAPSSPMFDLDSDSRLSWDSSKSRVSRSSVVKNLNDQFNTTQGSDIAASQMSFHDESCQDEATGLPFSSQDSFADYVPPSQEIRQLTGETLRTPIRPKIQKEANTSLAGF